MKRYRLIDFPDFRKIIKEGALTVNIGMETEQIEYKKTTGELKEAITSIVAILNKHGSGELYFGVRNNGDVLGQAINDETLRKVSQAIKNHITPAIFPEINSLILPTMLLASDRLMKSLLCHRKCIQSYC